MGQDDEEEKPLTAEHLRAQLVEQLVASGTLRSSQIKRAFAEVPREFFLPPELPLQRVYSDDAIVVKWNEAKMATSSSTQPSLMADMLEALDLQPGLKVLEIGAGVGYNAAIMAHILGDAALVTTVDLDPAMAEIARQNILKLGPNYERLSVIASDGSQGYSSNAPYDRIIVTVQQWEISPDWVSQLKEDGILLLPLSLSAQAWGGPIPAFRKQPDGTLVTIASSQGGFMPMRGQMAHPKATQNEVDALPETRAGQLKLGIPLTEMEGTPPANSENDSYVSENGLLDKVREWLQNPEQLHFIKDGFSHFKFKIEDLPEFDLSEVAPPWVRWANQNERQRAASRVYFGFTSLLTIAMEDKIAQLSVLINPPENVARTPEGEPIYPMESKYETYGLALALVLPDETGFDLALLARGTGYAWRVLINNRETQTGPENLALSKLNEIWEIWHKIGQPLPIDYRLIAYPANQSPPAPGLIVHRQFYSFLIPFQN